jgi:hypothetical protein
LARIRACGTLRHGIDGNGEIRLGGYMELLIVLVFAAGWVVVELVAKRYDKPRRDDPPPEHVERGED